MWRKEILTPIIRLYKNIYRKLNDKQQQKEEKDCALSKFLMNTNLFLSSVFTRWRDLLIKLITIEKRTNQNLTILMEGI